MTTAPKHRLRWYQYSVRSSFVLTVLVAIGGSWFAVRKQGVERQRVAVRAIEETGGFVVYDYQRDGAAGWIANPRPRGPGWLRAWLGDDFFSNVVAAHVKSDAELEYLNEFPRLLELTSIRTTTISSGALVFEGWVARGVTDEGLGRLAGLRQLRTLHLNGSQITDAGLQHLNRLPQLQLLDLSDTRITDAGLEHLRGLRPLERLNLTRTKVSDDGVKRLEEALPNCEIDR